MNGPYVHVNEATRTSSVWLPPLMLGNVTTVVVEEWQSAEERG